VRPSRTAATIEAKLSSASTISEASFAASVPLRPIATPTSARFSAGASLTPSPVMATTAPVGLQRLDQAQLVLGLVRAKTSCLRAASRSASSSSRSSSAPVITAGARRRAELAAMARAVAAWSPVIILTRMPASLAAFRHGGDGLLARRIDQADEPSKVSRGDVASAMLRAPSGTVAAGDASTRCRPGGERVDPRCQNSASIGSPRHPPELALAHSQIMRSGAPLTWMRARRASRCSVAM
jgi:hypothetical protein